MRGDNPFYLVGVAVGWVGMLGAVGVALFAGIAAIAGVAR